MITPVMCAFFVSFRDIYQPKSHYLRHLKMSIKDVIWNFSFHKQAEIQIVIWKTLKSIIYLQC